MTQAKGFFVLGVLLLCLAPTSSRAQAFTPAQKAPAYTAERQFIESTLETIVAIIQEATMQHESSGLGNRLRDITAKLSRAATLVDPTPPDATSITQNDLDDLRRMLRDVVRQLEDLREDLEARESYTLADRVRDVEQDLQRAVREADRLADRDTDDGRSTVSTEDGERWLRPGRYDDRYAERDDEEQDYDERDVEARIEQRINEQIREKIRDKSYDWDRDDENEQRRKRRRSSFDWHGYTGTFIGEYWSRWPYRRETALYRPTPAIRYNRVEGLVLGVGRNPLTWDSYGRSTIYGQAGYAFELKEWRATIGVETRVDNLRNDGYGLKIGGTYTYNTDTRDSWKTSWLENSLAAFFFENDFFDYYQVEGWSLYAVQRITPYLQLGVGYRDEDYRSLAKNTGWSLFDGGGFALNPAIDDGAMHSFVVTLEGGHVVGLHSLPRGAAFRFEAEVGDGLGGDFTFNRYIADVRGYVPLTSFSSFGLRLRGGLTTGDVVPLQKQFTLGGIGTVRGYPQNLFPGTRMLLANAEYVFDDINLFFDDWLDDFQLIGFVDLGWVNTLETNAFDFDDVIPSAGVGLGLDDRGVRLELAWPLRDLGTGQDPSLWLRITPSF